MISSTYSRLLALSSLLTALTWSTVASQCTNSIKGYTMIDADLDLPMGPLPPVIDYAALPTRNLNVRVEYNTCPSAPVASVLTQYLGGNLTQNRCEQYTPYSVFGQSSTSGPNLSQLGPFNPFTFPVAPGQTISAAPYTAAKCKGTKGQGKIVKMNVTNSALCPGKVLSFVLWDANTGKPERPILSGSKFCPVTQNYNIEARVLDCPSGLIGSVALSLAGAVINPATQKRNKYFLFGNETNSSSSITGGGPLIDGYYVLTAMPFEGSGGSGPRGLALTIPFQVDCSCVNKITGFTLIDADLNMDIGPFPNVLDYATLPTKNLNARANYMACPNNTIDSVLLNYAAKSGSNQLCERYTPYSVFGDNNPGGPDLGPLGKFYPFTFPVEPNQTIQATPFEGHKCKGVMGKTSQLAFDVVNSVQCPGKVLSVLLWDADKQTPETAITNGKVFCPQTKNYTIEARVIACGASSVNSVRFQLTAGNSFSVNKIQSEASDKFLLYGRSGEHTVSGAGRLANGNYTIAVTPYSGQGSNRTQGSKLSLRFVVACKASNGQQNRQALRRSK